MMANLAASLFAAEAITTTEAKAKALRPIAEKLITKAKKAQDGPMRVHRIRQIQGYLGDREMTHKLVNDVAPRYTRAQRRLHPDPEARHARRRQRPDGAHRTRLAAVLMRPPTPDGAGVPTGVAYPGRSGDQADGVVDARVRGSVAYDGTDFHGFAPNVGVRTVLGELSATISLVVRAPVELTGAGRTDAGVHAWGQVVSGDLPADTDLAGPGAARQQDARSGDRGARCGVGGPRLRRPVLGARAGTTATTCGTTRRRTRSRRGRRGTSRSRSTLWAMQAAGDPLIGEHDFASFCRRAEGGRR